MKSIFMAMLVLLCALSAGAAVKEKRLFWEPYFMYGGGEKNIRVGETTEGVTVNMSGGGGLGYGAGIGYKIAPRWNILAEFGLQTSRLDPAVSNGDASFPRTMLAGTVLYSYCLVESANKQLLSLNIGGGAGMYFPGKLTMNVSVRPDISYNSSTGWHIYTDVVLVECLTLGLRYTAVSYTATKYSFNGIVSVPEYVLHESPYEDYINLNGNSLDFICSLRFRF